MTKGKKVEFQNVLSTDQKDALFQTAILNVAVYRLVEQSEISLDCFSELDLYLWYIWEVVTAFFKRHRRLPKKKELRLELEARMNDSADYLDDPTVEDITNFYKSIPFAEPPLDLDTARDYLQRLFKEKAWRTLRQTSTENRKVPDNFDDVLGAVRTDLATASAVAATPLLSPFDQKQYDPIEHKHRLIPYGVPFIDAYLGGGGVPGEVYVVLSATGAGKTTLLQQLSISLASLQVAKWERSNKQKSLGMSYFVSYEMPGWEVMVRLYSNYAQIKSQKFFERLPLTRDGNLSEEEQVLFARAIEMGVRVPSEKERFEHAKKRLQHNWRLPIWQAA